MLTIRKATLADLEAITEIYNDAILNTVATFDTETKTLENRKSWFENHDAKHPVLVSEQDGSVVGWASLSKWSERLAYSGTAEVSLYVVKTHRGSGIGKKLLQALVAEGEAAGLHTLIGQIVASNEASIKLAKQAGFLEVGVLREVGCKFGRTLDVHIMQKIYE